MEIREIPGSNGYLVDETGVVYNSRMERLSLTRTSGGYIHCSLGVEIPDLGFGRFSVHRLVAWTFLLETKLPEHVHVNHRDSNPSNNTVRNLEWVTSSENNIHSEISRKGNLYPCVGAWIDGVPIGSFKNIHEAAAEYLLDDPLCIWDAIRFKKELEIEGIGQVMFTHLTWRMRKLFPKSKQLVAKAALVESRPVKLRDISTGEVSTFATLTQAAIATACKNNEVFRAAQPSAVLRLLKKQWQVAYLENEFAPVTDSELESALNRGAKDVVAYQVESHQYFIFESAQAFMMQFNLMNERRIFIRSLTTGKLKYISGWAVILLSPENVARLRQFVECPDSV